MSCKGLTVKICIKYKSIKIGENVWKDINYKEYGKSYMIDEVGNVVSKDRDIIKSNGVIQRRSGKTLNWCNNTDGYPTVKLSMDGKYERVAVHRLVAMTFVPNPNNATEVNHKDLDRSNPSSDNLEWVSHRDNVKYSHSLGRYKKPQYCREHNPKSKKVVWVEMDKTYGCLTDCAEDIIHSGYTSCSVGNARSQIIKVCKGKLHHYLGLHFKYA